MAESTPCYEHGLDPATLAPDSVGVPAPSVTPQARAAAADDSSLWLPAGNHWDLNIEHDHRVQTGPFTGGGWKLCWHITVSPWQSVDAMRDVLHAKAAEVHFVIGGRAGVQHPVVIQCLPLDQFGKGLVHAAGGGETNRARAIQVEICAEPQDMPNFGHYHALANLFYALTHGDDPRVPIHNRLARQFSNKARFTDSKWASETGHLGHMHCPQNDHVDPEPQFQGKAMVGYVKHCYEHGAFAL